jgi:hypothetical protein
MAAMRAAALETMAVRVMFATTADARGKAAANAVVRAAKFRTSAAVVAATMTAVALVLAEAMVTVEARVSGGNGNGGDGSKDNVGGTSGNGKGIGNGGGCSIGNSCCNSCAEGSGVGECSGGGRHFAMDVRGGRRWCGWGDGGNKEGWRRCRKSGKNWRTLAKIRETKHTHLVSYGGTSGTKKGEKCAYEHVDNSLQKI